MSVCQPGATPKRDSTNLSDHEYYGPLVESYIKSILKSGLLLDEDLEVLLSVSKFRNCPEWNGYRPSLSLLASIIALVASSVLAKKLDASLIAIPPIIVSACFAVIEYKNEKKKRENCEIVDKLLETLNQLQKLTKNVVGYMKTRCDLGKTKDQNSLLLQGKNVEDFMNAFLQDNSNVLEFLIDNLKTFTAYLPELQQDYTIIEYLKYSDILGCENVGNAETCLEYTHKVYDINVLIFSKLLSYIGVLFNSHTLSESDISNIINKILPDIIRTLRQHHGVIKKQFVALRHSTNKKSQIKLQNGVDKRKNISTRLEATLITSVNNLSVILEKSQNILDKLENGSQRNSTEIGDAIVDLRNHTFATYESLDLLCKLYGIISNSNVNKLGDNKINQTSSFKGATSSETLPTVNYNDDAEPVEEKFELYIGKQEAAAEHQTRDYEDQSGAYLSLMLQELKQSLKQHERFIQAKNKRGSEDDEEVEMERKRNSRRERRRSPPRFDLGEVRAETVERQDVAEDEKTADVPNLPPPPPPPLPAFSLGDLEQETGQIYARSMLENIKILSGQRNMEEEVFGNSDDVGDVSD